MSGMNLLELGASKLASNAFTRDYVARQAGTAKMQKIFALVMKKSIIEDGKIYRQKKGKKIGKPIGWIDVRNGTGWLNMEEFKKMRRDEDRPEQEN